MISWRLKDVGRWMGIVALVGLVGCEARSGGGSGGGNQSGNTNLNTAGNDNDNGPGRQVPCDENIPPVGEVAFPPENATVASGDVLFIWGAGDADDPEIRSTLFVSDRPSVFDNPIRTPQELVVASDALEHRTTVRLTQTGTFYWGVEITDGCGVTIRRPADGEGVPFRVTLSGEGRVGASDVILLCPRDTQLARQTTTFLWSLGDTVPQRATVFVSRADQPNPFDSPLRVLEVAVPTETFRTLTEDESLPADQELSWGLRIETSDQVLFTFEGQLGQSFVAGDNAVPSGALLGPEDGDVLADNTASFTLRWQADPGNCEDVLTSTVFLEHLGTASAPEALFASSIQVELGIGALELDLVPRMAELGLDEAGAWAWGVRADDGTDATVLSAGPSGATFRTFFRDTSPEFVAAPAVGWQACDPVTALFDTTDFGYADDNGADTVTVTLYYAPNESDVFTNPSATQTLSADEISESPEDVFFVVSDAAASGCAVFAQGTGFYGVELNDGVNDPARQIVEYAGPDCNGNGIPDSDDIARETAADCNGNGAPDECDITAGVSPDCNGTGIPDECELAGNDCNGSGVPDDCELADGDANGNGVLDVCEVAPITDCNGNSVPDDQDIASGTSEDCNNDAVPDECQGSPLVDAGTLQPGVVMFDGSFPYYSSVADKNNLSGVVCNPFPPNIDVTWIVESQPAETEVVINNPGSLTTSYSIFPVSVDNTLPGTYVFRLTEHVSGSEVSDTVTLTLVNPE